MRVTVIPMKERGAFLKELAEELGFSSEDASLRAAREVICGLRERLIDEEARLLEESVRSSLPELYFCQNESHAHRPPAVRREMLTEPEFAERVRVAAGLRSTREARRLIRIVMLGISELFGAEETLPLLRAERENVVSSERAKERDEDEE